MGGEDGGAEGEEGDDDAVQHHPRQQEPKNSEMPGWLVMSSPCQVQEVN